MSAVISRKAEHRRPRYVRGPVRGHELHDFRKAFVRGLLECHVAECEGSFDGGDDVGLARLGRFQLALYTRTSAWMRILYTT